jgi:hypothetical protein
VSPVKYELGFYIPEDDILHSHRRENPKSYRRSIPAYRNRTRTGNRYADCNSSSYLRSECSA